MTRYRKLRAAYKYCIFENGSDLPLIPKSFPRAGFLLLSTFVSLLISILYFIYLYIIYNKQTFRRLTLPSRDTLFARWNLQPPSSASRAPQR